MTLGYGGALYLLAFDHRDSLKRTLFDISGEPTAEQVGAIEAAKRVVFEGFRRAVASNRVPREAAGILVDEESGADVARAARREGFIVAMPLERSGSREFDLEYGQEFGAHVEAFDPAFCKVLVRYNPGDDRQMNARQADRLARLSDWLHERDRKFLFELLVPPTPGQMDQAGGRIDAYDRDVRPALMLEAIGELRDRGVEPDVWKIEGLEDAAWCRRLAERTREGGRGGVACVVLGRGADAGAVERWLRAGAAVPGYVGFAIGRTIWWAALERHLRGVTGADEAADEVAERYAGFVQTYVEAAGASAAGGG